MDVDANNYDSGAIIDDGSCFFDRDNDGVANAYDNCPLVANSGQESNSVIFAKANAANRALSENQDCITENVCLTR